MSSCAIGLLALLLGFLDTSFTASESPFSWTAAKDANIRQSFSPEERVLGAAMQRFSICLVDFHDARPYGDAADQRAWLVRYDGVRVPAPRGQSPVEVTLFLVFRHSSGDLVAAFTEAASMWASSGWTSEDITKRMATSWSFFSPESATLRSSVVQVLQVIWEHEGANPSEGGQITIRPRQFLRKATIRDESGNPIPQDKANGWLVEVLGRHTGTTWHGLPLSINIVLFRDGDLVFSGGLLL